MIYVAIIGCLAMSFIFFMLSRTDPSAYVFFFDGLAFIILISTVIMMIYRIRKSGSWNYFDKPKHNKPLLEFLYRDGSKRPILGERIPGMGFFTVKQLGLVQDIGRLPAPGSVYFHGDKPIRFVLQDINHTPNPKFAGWYHFLTQLGFNRIEEVQEVLQGYNPELMVKVWNRLMEYEPVKPADQVILDVIDMEKKDVKENNKLWQNDRRQIDRLIEKRERGKKEIKEYVAEEETSRHHRR